MNYLGVDFGLKKIGLATSEGTLAAPFKIIEVKGIEDAVEKISQIITVEGFEIVVVGQPEGKIGGSAKKFINGLKQKGFLVESIDEHLSTKNARNLMIELGVGQQKRKLNDHYSATLILQEYLDNL